MMTSFQQELTALAETADGGGTPAATPLWKAGVRRRRWAAVRSLIAVCVAMAGLAFVAWPGLRATPTPPASTAPPSGETPRAYPSVIAESHFPPSVLSARRSMAAVYLAGQTLFAVDDHGQTWKAPKAGGERAYAALSPDGRYATDGWAVYDFMAGTSTRLTSFSSLPREYLRIGAGWSPDSGHYAVIADAGTQAKVALGTPSGEFVQTPLLPPSGDTSGMTFGGCFAGSACPSVRVGWLDNTRLLLLVPAAPTPEDATRGSSLQAFTWAVGERDWQPEGALQLPPKSAITYGDGYAFGISPDGRTVALSVDIQDGGRGGTAVMTWPLPISPSQSATGAEAIPRSNFIDGITWRGRDLVVSRNGVTTVARTSEVLSEAGSGSGRPISWRADAFDGVPYYNAAAVWRDRLFVWAVLLGSLVVIVVGIRVARPAARRAGLLSDRYASPFPIEARWIYSR